MPVWRANSKIQAMGHALDSLKPAADTASMGRPPVFVRLYRYFWLFKLTPAGRTMVVGILLSAVGSVSLEVPIFRVFCTLIAVLGAAEFVGWWFRPKLEVEAHLPGRMVQGEELTVPIAIRNLGWLPAWDIMVGVFGPPGSLQHLDAEMSLPRVGSGETAELPLTLRARRRGVHVLEDIHVHTTFPLNLMRYKGASIPNQTVTVVPAFVPLDEFDLPLGMRYQPGGMVMTTGLGHSPEYAGNREYTPGEPVRRLDFKAWARTGKPVVREYQEESSCRIALVLDTDVPARGRGEIEHAGFESAISLIAAITDALDDRDYLVDLFAAGPSFHAFRTVGGAKRLDAVLEILAAVDACPTNPLEQLAPRLTEELDWISMVVCVFLDWDESRARFCSRIRESGCELKAVLVRNGPPTLAYSPAEGSAVSPHDVRAGRVRQL